MGWSSTFSLESLCNCPDPCTECCGVTVPCCPGSIPRTLFATFANSANCPGFDGAVIELTYDDGLENWSGSATICGETWQLGLSCSGVSCAGFGLSIFGPTNCQLSGGAVQVSCNCDPFEIVFTQDIGVIVCTCCTMNGTITITITA